VGKGGREGGREGGVSTSAGRMDAFLDLDLGLRRREGGREGGMEGRDGLCLRVVSPRFLLLALCVYVCVLLRMQEAGRQGGGTHAASCQNGALSPSLPPA